jgi:hypothetical protein
MRPAGNAFISSFRCTSVCRTSYVYVSPASGQYSIVCRSVAETVHSNDQSQTIQQGCLKDDGQAALNGTGMQYNFDEILNIRQQIRIATPQRIQLRCGESDIVQNYVVVRDTQGWM